MVRTVTRLWAGLWRDVVLNGVFASPFVPNRVRFVLLRLYGLDAAPSNVAAGVWFGSRRVAIGRGAFINRGCFFTTEGGVSIGARANLGMGVMVVTGSHEIAGPARRAGAATAAPVVIGDGAWLGARVMVLPGVKIGAGCVVAAGAVVIDDCEADALYAGVPARKLRELGVGAA